MDAMRELPNAGPDPDGGVPGNARGMREVTCCTGTRVGVSQIIFPNATAHSRTSRYDVIMPGAMAPTGNRGPVAI